MDVEPTAKTINDAAKRFRQCADELDCIAKKMRDREEIDYASEAFMTILGAINNSRIDLLITRPIRALSK